MRFLKVVIALGVATAFASPVLACDKDHSAKVDQTKQQTAQTTSSKTVQPDRTSKPHGG